MTDNHLILISGVQGAGKTTLAKLLVETDGAMFAADDYFYKPDGTYEFDATKLGHAHKLGEANNASAMSRRVSRVVVHNTFSRARELKPYIALAEHYKYRLISVVAENHHGSKDVHGVPQEVREEFATRIKQRLKLV